MGSRQSLIALQAGFKFAQIHDAVVSGVDGIGIGGAQILRYMDGRTGMHGPYVSTHVAAFNMQR